MPTCYIGTGDYIGTGTDTDIGTGTGSHDESPQGRAGAMFHSGDCG